MFNVITFLILFLIDPLNVFEHRLNPWFILNIYISLSLAYPYVSTDRLNEMRSESLTYFQMATIHIW